MKLPVPVPSIVLRSEIDGFLLVLRQIPLDRTEAPPAEKTNPPLVNEVEVISVTLIVTREGISSGNTFLQAI